MSTRAGLVFAVLALVVGLQWGVYLEQRAEREREVVAEQRMPAPAAPPTLRLALRCSQGVAFTSRNEPVSTARPWTRTEAEAARLHARMALETSRHYGGSMPHKQAWALEAIAGYLDVLICWGK